jgi:SAM-dependent methyltransferase
VYKNLNECLCCGSKELKLILDLNNQPLANDYHDKNKKLKEFPLALNLCKKCFHLQLTIAVNPDLMFKNYLYVSGTSKTMNDHFKNFANKIQFKNKKAKTILDIACNDGSQLDYFYNLGFETYGVDPAENLYKISSAKNHKIYCDYFNFNFVKKINKKFDLILAQNVFAHNDNPLEFLLSAKEILNNEGSIYIQTSQANMIKNNEFDTIYHEHISFFNLNSMQELCKRAGLYLTEYWYEDIHGTSYVFQINKKNISSVNNESENFLYNEKIYDAYAKKCYKIKNDFICAIKDLKKTHTLVGYGAAAKGNTFLNFAKVSLDYIIDDNKLKVGLYTPGSDTIIVGPETLDKNKNIPIVYIPLAWNFFNEIKNKINTKTQKKNLYLKYFPKVKVELI